MPKFLNKLPFLSLKSEGGLMQCRHCGASYSEDDNYCPDCGRKVGGHSASSSGLETHHSAYKGEYAGFWTRFIAYIIDGIILMVGLHILGVALQTTLLQFTLYPDPTTSIQRSIAGGIVGLLYFVPFEGATGATPGKMFLGLKILKENKEPITYVTAIIRYFGRIPALLIFGLGYIWIAFDKKKQGWHDKIAKTIVVNT
ncbi:MAG: RDD family protein [Nanoarchaeota archaeon]